jgi:hypothetical protein
MGLIVLIIWLGSLIVLGTPALALGIAACVKAKAGRDAAFWAVAAASALASVIGQHVAVFLPFVRRSAYSFDLVMALAFGWHLLAPAVLAAFLWVLARALRQTRILGAVAGLFLSIPLGIALALPVFFTVPSLLGLTVEH